MDKETAQFSQGTRLKVYYDGLCHLCSREINHYQKLPGSEQIQFIDITQSQFDPVSEKLNPFEIHQVMHARKSDGTVLTKVDAFLEIWKVIPKYQWLIPIVTLPIIRPCLDFFYIVFAKWIRPYLPKKAQSCETSPYCEMNINSTPKK